MLAGGKCIYLQKEPADLPLGAFVSLSIFMGRDTRRDWEKKKMEKYTFYAVGFPFSSIFCQQEMEKVTGFSRSLDVDNGFSTCCRFQGLETVTYRCL